MSRRIAAARGQRGGLGLALLGGLGLALLVGPLLACQAPPGRLETETERRRAGTPLGRSAHLRSGSLTWRLGTLDRQGGALRVDLVLQNGSARSFDHLLLRVRVVGRDGGQASARLPVGGLRAGRSHRVSAYLGDVPFPVGDVLLELLAAAP